MPMIFFLSFRQPATKSSTLSRSPISWSILMTPSLAPPCNGPLSVPMAEVMAEYMPLSVAMVTRAEKVEAFMPWSACRM